MYRPNLGESTNQDLCTGSSAYVGLMYHRLMYRPKPGSSACVGLMYYRLMYRWIAMQSSSAGLRCKAPSGMNNKRSYNLIYNLEAAIIPT